VPFTAVDDADALFSLVPERGPLVALPFPDVDAGSDDRYVRMAREANVLRHELAQARSAAAGADDRVAAVAAERDRLAAEVAELTARITDADAVADELNARLEATEAERDDLVARLTDAEAELTSLEDERDTLAARLAEADAAAEDDHREDRFGAGTNGAVRPVVTVADPPQAIPPLHWDDVSARTSEDEHDATARIAAIAAAHGPVAGDEAPTRNAAEEETRIVRRAPLTVGYDDEYEYDEEDEDEDLSPVHAGAPVPAWTAHLTPARIAVGGVLFVIVLWFVLILLGLGPI
jgi:TolA-binding protein